MHDDWKYNVGLLVMAVASAFLADVARGGVLEDVLGLEDTFSSPWPWPRSSSPWPWPRRLQVLENVLSSARGQRYFLIG